KVIMYARQDYAQNTAHWRDRTWKLSEVLSHEMVHCYQHHRFGYRFPVKTPTWIVEGYAEYIARQEMGKEQLKNYLSIYLKSVEAGKQDWEWIRFSDDNGSPVSYLRYRLLVQYLLEVEKQSYESIIQQAANEQETLEKLKSWHAKNVLSQY
ncbi:MAG: basic secretory protein-like protein, partial [Bacteroidota bacterium]